MLANLLGFDEPVGDSNFTLLGSNDMRNNVNTVTPLYGYQFSVTIKFFSKNQS